MSRILTLFLILSSLGCSKSSNQKINEFESILGEEKTEAFNKLVQDFESNLTELYPNLSIEESYRQYLLEIKSDTLNNSKKFQFQSPETAKAYHDSGLLNEIYERDSLGLQANNLGDYMRALMNVKDSDILIKNYCETRQASGLLPNEIFVNGILNSNPDFNNYFHKRIVVAEFSF